MICNGGSTKSPCNDASPNPCNDTSPKHVARKDQFCRNCGHWKPYQEDDREPEVGDLYPEVGGYCGNVPPEKWEPQDYGSYPPWVHSGAWCKDWTPYKVITDDKPEEQG